MKDKTSSIGFTKKMFNSFRFFGVAVISIIVVTIWLAGCGGGGGGKSVTHSQLAQRFVRAMNIEAGYDVVLVKIQTLEQDYIVVYDNDLDSFDAYWIGNYRNGNDIDDYIDHYEHDFYYDLDELYGSPVVYEDWFSGVQFENGYLVSRSSSATQEYLANQFKAGKSQVISDRYGLSYERAGELVTLAMNYKALSHKGALTKEEYDDFAMEAVGTSASELIRMAKENDVARGLGALKRAANTNGIGVEHATRLLSEEFGLTL